MLRIGDLTVDPDAKRVKRAGTDITLTTQEFAVLQHLALHAGHVVSKSDILDHVWDFAYDGDPTIVEVYVSALRHKIGVPFGRRSITTASPRTYASPPSRSKSSAAAASWPGSSATFSTTPNATPPRPSQWNCVPTGEGAVLTVTDDGHGVAPEWDRTTKNPQVDDLGVSGGAGDENRTRRRRTCPCAHVRDSQLNQKGLTAKAPCAAGIVAVPDDALQEQARRARTALRSY